MDDCKEHQWKHIANRSTMVPGPDSTKSMTIEWCAKCGCLAIGKLIGWKDGRDIFSPRIDCNSFMEVLNG